MGDFTEKLKRFLKDIGDAVSEEQKAKALKPSSQVDILTVGKLSQLKWMTASQLALIYKYGKVKTKIDDDPNAYAQLKWFTQEQLKAIFGEEDL